MSAPALSLDTDQIAEQNARAALRFAKRALVLEDGRLAMEGASVDLLGDRRVVDAYIGLGNSDLGWKTGVAQALEQSEG